MYHFTEIKPKAIDENTFKLIGTDWMLVTAGTKDKFNTMTASWGGLGIMWNKKVSFIFIRPQRYTLPFIEENDSFTLSFFDHRYREALKFCGSHSGRDVNKVAETGLTPRFSETGAVSFEEAKLIIECRKLYRQDFSPAGFCDPSLEKNYPEKDYHRMFIGEIISCCRSGEEKV